jgi:hypothetical protein
VEVEQMKNFVRNSSKGLAEVTRKSSEVQFIHESVRDFLLGKYGTRWSGFTENIAGHSHRFLSDICLAQMNASISEAIEIPDPLPKGAETKQLREAIRLKFPFVEYAVQHVLRHADCAQQNGLDESDFLTTFPRQRWIVLNNTLEQYQIRRYTPEASLVYLLAEYNLAALIRIHPDNRSCLDPKDERYGPPILAALATGSHEATRAFLEALAKTEPSDSPIQRLWKNYPGNRENRAGPGRDFTFFRKRRVCSYLAQYGEHIIIDFLLALGKYDVNLKGAARTPLSWAAGVCWRR